MTGLVDLGETFVVGDLIVETRLFDAVDALDGHLVLHAGHRQPCAVTGDHDRVGHSADADGVLVAGDRPALVDAGDDEVLA